MDLITLAGTAFALAMDAFAVSVASGIALKNITFRQTFRLSWHFGVFQALMPIIGWSAGIYIRSYIEQFDHWIAFVLLLFVGGNMIREALHKEEEKKQKKDPTKGTTLVLLSVATSIDALAVGLSLSMVNISIWFPALIIGIVATTFTGIGLHLGKKIGQTSHLCSYAEALGGIVLVGIGLKILSEHNVFSNVM